jgi:hypothetical protein
VAPCFLGKRKDGGTSIFFLSREKVRGKINLYKQQLSKNQTLVQRQLIISSISLIWLGLKCRFSTFRQQAAGLHQPLYQKASIPDF